MPTVRIFGQEVEKKKLLIGGGLLAAAVAVIVFLRARAGASVQQAAAAPQEDAGYGGGMSVAAPSGQVASAYEQQMQNSELEAQVIANKYQQNLVTQQEKQYEFQNRMQEQLAPDILANERQTLAADTEFQRVKTKIPFACPPDYARAKDVNGDLTCNPKGSGSPITHSYRAVNEFTHGIEQEAPSLGRQAARDAFAYGEAQLGIPPGGGKRKSTPPIAPSKQWGDHGYGET